MIAQSIDRKEKDILGINKNASRLLLRAHSTFLSCSFCALVKLVGNLILTPTTKSPRSFGFFDLGMPRLGNRSVHVGPLGPPLPTLSCLPSIVCTVRRQPVRASLRSRSMVCLMSSPSRVKRGWDFCHHVSTVVHPLRVPRWNRSTHLRNDEMQVLRASFDLIAHV
jgi:hypothetical protein